MTLPAVIRIFFAIDLPPLAKEQLAMFVESLKKKLKSNAIRWSKPENLHITLQFLAEVKTEHLDALQKNVRAHLKDAAPISAIQIGAIHLFPSPFRPRVIVCEITPQEELRMLAKLIGDGILATPYEIDERPFRAHLTLGRIKQPKVINPNFLNDVSPPNLEKIEIREIILFRSEPQADGSKYTILDKIPLANATR